MKSVQEVFVSCAAVVEEQFPAADASEKLRAALGLVDLSMRGVAEENNQKRWEGSATIMAQAAK